MSSPAEGPPPEHPSFIWPIFAVVAWGLVLYQVYAQIPQQHLRLRELNVLLPDGSRWVLENARWLGPGLGIMTVLLTAWIPRQRLRWMLTAFVAVVCLLGLLWIQWLALLQLMAGDHPRGL